jgi:hypothetical protein
MMTSVTHMPTECELLAFALVSRRRIDFQSCVAVDHVPYTSMRSKGLTLGTDRSGMDEHAGRFHPMGYDRSFPSPT